MRRTSFGTTACGYACARWRAPIYIRKRYAEVNRHGSGGNRTAENHRNRRPRRRPARPNWPRRCSSPPARSTGSGRPDDGSAAMDFEPEETRAPHLDQLLLSSSQLEKDRSNPRRYAGLQRLSARMFATMRAVDGVVFVATRGRRSQGRIRKDLSTRSNRLGLPRIAFISRLDRERMSFEAAMTDLEKTLEAKPVVLTLPIGEEADFSGVIDVLAMKALIYADASGKLSEEELTGDLKRARRRGAHSAVRGGRRDRRRAARKVSRQGRVWTTMNCARRCARAVIAGKLTPVLCGSGAKNIGIGPLLDAVATLLPAPNERPALPGPRALERHAGRARARSRGAILGAWSSRRVIDPFAGKLSIFRVISGRAVSDADGAQLDARHRASASVSCCGSRARSSRRSPRACRRNHRGRQAQGHHHRRYALRRKGARSSILRPSKPAPVISFAIRPKTRGDEEKVLAWPCSGWSKRIPRSKPIAIRKPTKSFCPAPARCISRSRSRSSSANLTSKSNLQAPKVPYKETIKGRAEAQGKYKRQSGGRGQYGDCWLKIEPLARGGGFEFVDQIVGGAIPRQFIPSVEKGVRNTLVEGYLAGYPDGRRQGHRLRRQLSRRRFFGYGVPDCGLDGLQERARKSPADHPRTDHGGRSGLSRRMHGRRHRRPQFAPRARCSGWTARATAR